MQSTQLVLVDLIGHFGTHGALSQIGGHASLININNNEIIQTRLI